LLLKDLLKYKTILVIAFCLSTCIILAQQEFNKIYEFGLIQHNSYGILPIDEQYLIKGQGLDTTSMPLEASVEVYSHQIVRM